MVFRSVSRLGPKDLSRQDRLLLVRRDTREKTVVELENLTQEVEKLLDTMQHEMLERAREHRDSHTYEAHNYEEFTDIVEHKPGFIKAMWCGDQACEDKIKEDTAATSPLYSAQRRSYR